MREYIVYGSRKVHFTQKVRAKNKKEAEELADMGEWTEADYDDDCIGVDEVELQ